MNSEVCVCVCEECVMGVIACAHCVDSMCVFRVERNEGAGGSNCVRSGMFFCMWFSKTMEKASFIAVSTRRVCVYEVCTVCESVLLVY